MLRGFLRNTYHCGRALCNVVTLHGRAWDSPQISRQRAPLIWAFNYNRFLFTNNTEGIMADNRYAADYAKVGTSSCKKCKQKLEKGSFRIAKVVTNPFTDEGGDMKQYHHPKCIFETFLRARPTTKIIEDPDDLENFDILKDEDKDLIKTLIKDLTTKKGTQKKTPTKRKASPAPVSTTSKTASSPSTKADKPSSSKESAGGACTFGDVGDDPLANERDNSFRQFRRLCADIAEDNSHTGKTNLVATYLSKGNSGDGFKGDVYILLKFLLPNVVKTIYHLNNKQLVKIFSQIFGTNLDAMVEDLEQGDVAETVKTFFEESKYVKPQKKSNLSNQQVDELLTELARYSKEDDQQTVLTQIAKRSTANDLKMVVRLIKHDLRINAGAKNILDGLDQNAYNAFQTSRNLRDVVERVIQLRSGGLKKKLSIRANLMTPILPMLAEACKSVEYALKKCPNGMYAEIKYDGERVQVHKQGDEFSYFSRSLKPVLPHKVNHFKDFIPKAFPHGNDLILDSEVLMIDTKTGNPLPFGTLGVHKKQAFKDANVALFIFDCLHINGENLMNKPVKERRKILKENMTEIPNRILFSEMKHITKKDDLKDLMMKVFREGLEGLVLKDVNSIYEPGKRHWLKVKKDYLADGAMADSADLLVLGAYYGTGRKGGILSTFLMGVHDPASDTWKTVTKTTGFDDAALEKLQKELKPNLEKINKDYTKVPAWLQMSKNLTPDFVVIDPKKSVVWEITGAEFSKSDHHTAGGISIRFPRFTKDRNDKTWETATNLPELKELFKKSKQTADLPDVLGGTDKKGRGKKATSADADDNESDEDMTDEDDESTNNNAVTRKAKQSPKKRSMDDHVEASPAKKVAKEECKYGAACYQTSPAHRAKFSHPTNSSKHLPDVFRGMKFFVPDSVEDKARLCRYITAFDGDVLPEYEKDNATHTVVKDAKEANSTDKVSAEWVWKCIKKKKLISSSA